MNHADAPNTGVPTEASDPEITVTLRPIAAGEELTCDYFAFDAQAHAKLGSSPTLSP
jgi:SET domain-containing protein